MGHSLPIMGRDLLVLIPAPTCSYLLASTFNHFPEQLPSSLSSSSSNLPMYIYFSTTLIPNLLPPLPNKPYLLFYITVCVHALIVIQCILITLRVIWSFICFIAIHWSECILVKKGWNGESKELPILKAIDPKPHFGPIIVACKLVYIFMLADTNT